MSRPCGRDAHDCGFVDDSRPRCRDSETTRAASAGAFRIVSARNPGIHPSNALFRLRILAHVADLVELASVKVVTGALHLGVTKVHP
eukprot:2603426-Rhodomonas_salina.2